MTRNQKGENNNNWKGGILFRKKQVLNKESHRKSCKKYIEKYPEKRRESYMKYIIKNKNKIRMKQKLEENKLKKRNQELIKTYGITLNEFLEKIISQNNQCAICKNQFKDRKDTHIDHNHQTNKLRGLLCSRCNLGLGQFKDNINNLELAILYLKQWN